MWWQHVGASVTITGMSTEHPTPAAAVDCRGSAQCTGRASSSQAVKPLRGLQGDSGNTAQQTVILL